MYILLTIHSITRWLVVLAGVLAIVFLTTELNTKEHVRRKAKIAYISFAHLMTLQALLGLGVLYQFSETIGIQRIDWEHAGTMIVAAIVANIPQFLKKMDTPAYKKAALYATIGALVLVLVGVASLGGIAKWTHIHGLF